MPLTWYTYSPGSTHLNGIGSLSQLFNDRIILTITLGATDNTSTPITISSKLEKGFPVIHTSKHSTISPKTNMITIDVP